MTDGVAAVAAVVFEIMVEWQLQFISILPLRLDLAGLVIRPSMAATVILVC